jgi:hypothetical protein
LTKAGKDDSDGERLLELRPQQKTDSTEAGKVDSESRASTHSA